MHSRSENKGEVLAGARFLVVGLLSNIVFSLPPYTAGIFIEPLNAEFGWSRTDVSMGVTVLTVGMAIGGMIAGQMLSRWGAKRMIICGLIGYATGYVLLANMGSGIWAFWCLFGAMALVGAMASPVTVSRLISDHFLARRGLALGFTMVGSGVAAALAPLTLVPTVTSYGWRGGYVALAVVAGVAAAASAALLRLDGSTVNNAKESDVVDRGEANSRTGATLVISVLFVSLAVGGAVVHMVPILQDAGLRQEQVALFGSLIGIGVVAGRLFTGTLLDRVTAGVLAGAIMGAGSVGFLVISFIAEKAPWLAPLVVGISLGAELDIAAYLASRFFPPRKFGKVFGVVFFAFQSGLAVSPVVYGLIRDRTEQYQLAFLFSAVLLAASAVMFLSLPRPARFSARTRSSSKVARSADLKG
jgi:MFS family permease